MGALDPEAEDEDAALFGDRADLPATSQPAPMAELEPDDRAFDDPPPPSSSAVPAHGPAARPPDARAAQSAPAKRSLDAAVLAVLREEAERETAARKAESARGVEVQPDLGLPERPGLVARAATGETTELPVTQRPGIGRRDLLPDIEEINSTLRAGSEARIVSESPGASTDERSARGFRAGFATMLIVATILVLGYVMAPRIAAYLPGSAPTMERYVTSVNILRLWLDGALQGVVTQLRGLSGQDG